MTKTGQDMTETTFKQWCGLYKWMRHVQYAVQQVSGLLTEVAAWYQFYTMFLVGSFGEAGPQTDQYVEWLREYCQAFFYGLSVKLLPAVTVAETGCSFRVNSYSHNLQILTRKLESTPLLPRLHCTICIGGGGLATLIDGLLNEPSGHRPGSSKCKGTPTRTDQEQNHHQKTKDAKRSKM